jgi:superfamily II DNA or RNA helicase
MTSAVARVDQLDERTLAVRNSYDLREQLKALPGARWDAMERAWLFPRSPVSARALLAVVPSAAANAALAALAGVAAYERRLDPALDVPLPSYSSVGPAWAHQTRAARWLAGREAALLQYGLRTGKTRATLDALRFVGAQLTVVLCPLNACAVWEREAARHHPEHFRFLRLDTRSVARRAALLGSEVVAARALGKPLLVALNYESSWRTDMASALLALTPDALVLDEIHRLAGPTTRQSKFAAKLRAISRRRWGLSGTPIPHSPENAYGVFRALDPGVFGSSWGAFKARFLIFGGFNNHQIVGYQNVEEFRERYFALTLAASRDVLDLPDAVHETVEVELPPEARRIHDLLKKESMALLASGTREVIATNILTRLLRQAQVASGHCRTDAGLLSEDYGSETEGRVEEVHRAKETALGEIIADLDDAEPVVVFARFRYDFLQIERATRAAGREYCELSGKRRDLDAWLASSRGDVLAVQFQAGSEGIDLSRASYCVFYDDVFSLAQTDQATARIHGPGSRKSVMYFHLVAKNTVDEYVRETLRRRRGVLERILDEREL